MQADELVLLALPGVQQFIGETRSLSDVRAASEIYARLAAVMAGLCTEPGDRLIFPSGSAGFEGMPNRVVALFPEGTWESRAAHVQGAVEETWKDWVRRALRVPAGEEPRTPGMPVLQWVCVPAADSGYAGQWETAQRLMDARRRVRDFPAVEYAQRQLCSVGPRWPAEPSPPGLREHEEAALSAAGWVKRQWRRMHDLAGFASTASIASAPFRQAVLGHLADRAVRDAVSELSRAGRHLIRLGQGADVRETPVPGLTRTGSEPGEWLACAGGPWVYLDQWQAESLARELKLDVAEITPLARQGLSAVRRLHELMAERGVRTPANYVAVVAQDIDNMGKFLGGHARNAAGDRLEVAVEAHQRVSSTLQHLAARQREVVEDPARLGLAIYAGGDDLLAFCPASKAITLAQACHDEVPPDLPRASTAILYFHYHASMQDALTTAWHLLDTAKARVRDKHALGVGYLRRSGVRETSIQPWLGDDGSSAAAFGVFAADQDCALSPRLLSDLDRDRDELARLSVSAPDYYQAELARLVRRHTSARRQDQAASDAAAAAAAATARALNGLGSREATERPPGLPAGARPQLAARVAVFLRQEAR